MVKICRTLINRTIKGLKLSTFSLTTHVDKRTSTKTFRDKVMLKVNKIVERLLLRKENNFKLQVRLLMFPLLLIMRYTKNKHLAKQVVIFKVTRHRIIHSIILLCNKLNIFRANCVLHRCNKTYNQDLIVHKLQIKILYCRTYFHYVKVLFHSKMIMNSVFKTWM